MEESKCCGTVGSDLSCPGHEAIAIEKARNTCPSCENYAMEKASKPIAVMCCEGGCLRGEIARQAANLICHKIATDKTVRICLGGAFTKDTGQRSLVRNAKELIALEGCFIECASRMMKGVIPDLNPRIIITDGLIDFDRNLFGIDEMSEEETKALAMTIAQKVVEEL